MKVTVVGLGYVGAVAAAGLALADHEVLAVDIDQHRLDLLKVGKVPFYEPGLEVWVTSALQRGSLRFLHRDEVREGLGDVVLVAVGTPPTRDAAADLRYVTSTVSWIKGMRPRDLVIVMKSTVPPGTGRKIVEQELAGTGIGYVANPEFLREGQALRDWTAPDRIVIGADSPCSRSIETVKRLYAGIDAPHMVTDITSAEMLKYANNAFLATRISFINEIATLCDSVGASIDEVSEGLAMDSRTGSRLYAGVGYGGSCFPKDVDLLVSLARGNGRDVDLLSSVISVNDRQRLLPLLALRERFDGALAGLEIGVLGLAFKPGTDDVRKAPALDVVQALAAEGVKVRVFDPKAMASARSRLPSSVRPTNSVEEAADQAHALVLLTEWDEIVNAPWESLAKQMRSPRVVFDGRNALDPASMKDLGFEYVGIGRNSQLAEVHRSETRYPNGKAETSPDGLCRLPSQAAP